MAFSFFGKRPPEPETTTVAEPDQAPAPETKLGFFDRMKQAVTRTRETLTESLGSVIALTRARAPASPPDLDAVLLAADIGTTTTSQVIENLRQRALRHGIEGGA